MPPTGSRSAIVWLGLLWGLTTLARAEELSGEQLFLADLPVVLTASRLAQPLLDAPSAMSVIDRRMIEASGLRDLAELIRLVPGFQVALVNGYFHAVSHGMQDEYSSRMQVQVDGRSVYLPTFGGVRWDALPLALEDIERIEVTRGPNAATYGANAFTGVINIITRHPEDVPRDTAVARLGQEELREAIYRHAGGEGRHHYRITAGWQQNEGFAGQEDSLHAPMLNYRGTLRWDGRNTLSLQMGYKGGNRGVPRDFPGRSEAIDSDYLQLDWRRELADGALLEVQLSRSDYASHEDVVNPPFPFAPDSVSVDSSRLDGQVQLSQAHSAALRTVVGAGLRRDAVKSAHYFATGATQALKSASLFGHAEWRLAAQWLVNAGLMLEDHDIGSRRASPRLALHWQPAASHSLRLGVSRAYRNPVVFEERANWLLDTVAGPLPWLVSSGGLRPEQVDHWELGYLALWPRQGLSLDLRLYRSAYDGLIAFTGSVRSPPRDVDNPDWATLSGMDGQVRWQLSEASQIIANFAYTRTRSSDLEEKYTRATPPHQYGLLAMHRLPGGVDVSLGYYWSQGIEAIGAARIESGERIDARIAKEFRIQGVRGEVALVLQGLGAPYHEFDENQYNLFKTRGHLHVKLEF